MTEHRNTALVTGASMGLGEAFARELAARGVDLILVARSKDKLEQLAESLRAQCNVHVVVIVADLTSAESVQYLTVEVKRRGLHVDLLINNAGLGVFEPFLDTSLAKQLDQVDLNIRALVSLTYAFVPAMVIENRGGVINLASTAAFQPLAGATVSAASKAFVLFFSEGLALELHKGGVKVMAACPGPVATHFFAKMKPKASAREMDQPAPVVKDILRGFEQGKHVVYPGKLTNRLGTWGARFLPRTVILRLAAGITQKLNQR